MDRCERGDLLIPDQTPFSFKTPPPPPKHYISQNAPVDNGKSSQQTLWNNGRLFVSQHALVKEL